MKHCMGKLIFLLFFMLLFEGVGTNTRIQRNRYVFGDDTLVVPISPGWNMISLPVKLQDSSLSILFPHASSKAFSFDHGYVIHNTIRSGLGYWLKAPSTETVIVKGSAILSDTFPLSEGWNMTGSLSLPISKSKLTTTPPGIISSNYFTYDAESGYVAKDTLLPGRSYWVKVSQPGTLRGSCWDDLDNVLVSPVDKGDALITPTLRWKRSQCSNQYRLQIAPDSLFNTIVADTVTADTTYQGDTLELAKNYYWRVGLPTGNGKFLWSSMRSFHTATWQYVGLGTQAVGPIIFDPTDSLTIYAGSVSDFSGGTVGGIFKSTDKGATWDTLVRGVTANVLVMDPTNSMTIYAVLGLNFLTQAGILKTTNGGTTWARADSGIRITFEEGPANLAVDPQHPETLYAGSDGPFGGPLYSSTDGGRFWVKNDSATASGIYGIGVIEIDPLNSNVLYVGVQSLGELFKTTNAGNHWTRLLSNQQVNDAKLNPRSPDTIYAATSYNGIYISTNAGATWSPANNGFPKAPRIRTGIIAMNGFNPRYLCTNLDTPPSSYTQEFYKTTNGGELWQLVPSPASPYLGSIAISPHSSELYADSYAGIFKYVR